MAAEPLQLVALVLTQWTKQKVPQILTTYPLRKLKGQSGKVRSADVHDLGGRRFKFETVTKSQLCEMRRGTQILGSISRPEQGRRSPDLKGAILQPVPCDEADCDTIIEAH